MGCLLQSGVRKVKRTELAEVVALALFRHGKNCALLEVLHVIQVIERHEVVEKSSEKGQYDEGAKPVVRYEYGKERGKQHLCNAEGEETTAIREDE